jgi:hypothetical protein
MAMAEHFVPKTELISDLKIAPTAAYLLAAPSAPDEARQAAIERAESGETITTAVAKEILAKSRKKRGRQRSKASPDALTQRLAKVLERYHELWDQKDLASFAKQLRDFADSLEGQQQGGKKKAKQR